MDINREGGNVLPLYVRIPLYLVVFILFVTGWITNHPVLLIPLGLLVAYLIYVVFKGYYFYRATAIMMLLFLFIVSVWGNNNYTTGLLLIFMAVDVII